MSIKDFEAIAEAINRAAFNTIHNGGFGAVRDTAQQIANVCADNNPRFNRDRFLQACGVSEANEVNEVNNPCIQTYRQPKTGQKCSCRPGIERDNCSACETTGWRIDFAAIRERNNISKGVK